MFFNRKREFIGTFGQRVAYDRSKDVIVFLHIEKTAGTTFNQAMNVATERENYDWYSNSGLLEAFGAGRTEQLDALSGHFAYGIDCMFSRRLLYFTLIRDPLDRIESWYYYQRISTEDNGYRVANELNLNEWVEHLIQHKSSYLHNFQASRILGVSGHLPNTDRVVSRAMQHIQKHFFYIATHDHVADMTNAVAGMMQLDLQSVQNAKVSPNRPRVSVMSEENRARLVELNLVDCSIHKWVRSLQDA